MSTRQLHILFFGDSHTVGVGDPSGLGWVGRIVAATHTAEISLVACNLGVRGETSRDLMGRWRGQADGRASEVQTRMVLAIGANDTAEEDGIPRVEPAESVETLAALLRQADAAALPTLVVGPAPVGDDQQMDRIAELSDRFAELCGQMGVPFVDVATRLRRSEAWRKEIAASDEAHPGATGYEELAQIILDNGFLDWLGANAPGVAKPGTRLGL